MRVSAGQARGRELKVPSGRIRPTSQLVREAVFNVWRPLVPESRFLELFAGSGSMGIEALSRGARSCLFVEKNPAACRIIRENLHSLQFADRAEVWNLDVTVAVKKIAARGWQFDLIYLDPPYDYPRLEALVAGIPPALLTEVGMMAIETRAGMSLRFASGLVRYRQKRYGDTAVTFLRKVEGDAQCIEVAGRTGGENKPGPAAAHDQQSSP